MPALTARLASDWKWHAAVLLLLICATAIILAPSPRRHSEPTAGSETSAVQPAVPPVDLDPMPASDDLLDYTVQENDTVASIGRLFEVRAEDLRAVNGLAADEEFQSGTRIKIPPSAR